MSYILDALKKSEQERRTHKAAPDLSTIHQAPETAASQVPLRFVLWLVLIGAFVSISWWGYSHLSFTDVATTKVQTPDAKPMSSSPIPPQTPATQVSDNQAQALYQRDAAPQNKQVSRLYQADTTAPAAAVQALPSENGSLPNIRDLPPSLQGQIAPMDYSAHVYSSDVSRGFAIINGKRRYREDRMENGLTVVTVLEEAVVMEYMGQLFVLDAMQNWPGK